MRTDVGHLIQAVRSADEAAVDDAVLRLSRSRPWLAPLALAIGALAMLFDGVKLLFTNWRLTLVQVLPAMWIWAAMYDLKAKVLRGKEFIGLSGSALAIWLVVGITVITAACFYLNAVFAFAIVEPGRPAIRPAFSRARYHLARVLGSGAILGILLGLSAIVVPRYWGGLFWFAVSLSIVIGIMMICYVAVPSRLIGIKASRSGYSKRDKLTASAVGGVVGAVVCTPPYLLIGVKTTYSRRDKLTVSAVGGTIGAVVCTPPYVLGRVGLLMLGSKLLFVPGIILLAVGATLMAAATGAVKTVRLSARLVFSPNRAGNQAPSAGTPGLGR